MSFPSVSSKRGAMIVDFPQLAHKRTVIQSKRRKSVQFSPTSSLHLFFTDDDEQPPTTWYNQLEYSSFHETVRSDVRLARSISGAADINSDVYEVLTTGVEHLICRETTRLIFESRRVHRDAILREYARQRFTGVSDPEALRELSRMSSSWATQRALKQAHTGKRMCGRGPLNAAAC